MGGRTSVALHGSPIARPTAWASGADAEAAMTKSARRAVVKSLWNIVSVGRKNVGRKETQKSSYRWSADGSITDRYGNRQESEMDLKLRDL